MKYTGNIEIKTTNDADKLKNITEITGYLSIYSGAKLDASALTSVGGDLSISSGAKLDASALTSVGGDLYIHSDAKLDALTSVGGYLYIHSDAKLDAPSLTSVGGDLYISYDAKLDAPSLTSVGGDLSISSDAKLDASALYSKGFDSFKILDGISCVVLSTKKLNGIDILSCRKSRVKNNKLVGEKFFIARMGNNNAHGKTISEAIQELKFKTEVRDVSQYKNMPMSTSKTPTEWSLIYRTITGACKYGTDTFMAGKKLKKRYTLKQIIEETSGAWGHETFVKCVK